MLLITPMVVEDEVSKSVQRLPETSGIIIGHMTSIWGGVKRVIQNGRQYNKTSRKVGKTGWHIMLTQYGISPSDASWWRDMGDTPSSRVYLTHLADAKWGYPLLMIDMVKGIKQLIHLPVAPTRTQMSSNLSVSPEFSLSTHFEDIVSEILIARI